MPQALDIVSITGELSVPNVRHEAEPRSLPARRPGRERPVSCSPMALGELVFGNVVDLRVFKVEGEQGATGIYTLGTSGHALPFVVYRAWKVSQGTVPEEIRFFGPSGKLVYRWGPKVRRMRGMMDLTVEQDVIEDARLTETGLQLAA